MLLVRREREIPKVGIEQELSLVACAWSCREKAAGASWGFCPVLGPVRGHGWSRAAGTAEEVMGGGAEVPQWIFSGGRTWESFSLQFSLKCGGKYVQLSSVSVPCAIIYGAQFSRSLRCHFCSQIFMANQTCAQPGTCLFSSAPCVAVPREPGKGCSPGMGARAALGASAAGLGAEEPCLGWERGAVVLAHCSAATRACKQGLEPEVLRGHRAAAPAPAPASHQPGSCCVLQPAWFLGSLGAVHRGLRSQERSC